MNMAPDGIALADGAPDRDGLQMDQLHVRLGPIARHWPTGLVLDWTLQGDVITDARGDVQWGAPSQAGLLDTSAGTANPSLLEVAWRADNLATLLELAGAGDHARAARRLRDVAVAAVLHDDGSATSGPPGGGNPDPDSPRVSAVVHASTRLSRRIRRDRILRWTLRAAAAVDVQQLAPAGAPPRWAGDCADRLALAVAELDRVTEQLTDSHTARRHQHVEERIAKGSEETAHHGAAHHAQTPRGEREAADGTTGASPGRSGEEVAGPVGPQASAAAAPPVSAEAVAALTVGLDVAVARLFVATLNLNPLQPPANQQHAPVAAGRAPSRGHGTHSEHGGHHG